MLKIRAAIPPEGRVPDVSPSRALWRLGIVDWLGRFPVLERRRTEFGLWWGARTPRERRLLLVLGGTALLVLLLAGIYRPLSDIRSRAIADIHTYEVLAAQLRIAGPELARLRSVDRSGSAATVASSAATFGLMVSPIEGEDGSVRVSVQDGDFTKIVQWLAQVESSSTFRLSGLRVERQAAPGLVDAEVVLGR